MAAYWEQALKLHSFLIIVLALFTLVSPTSAVAVGCSEVQGGIERSICSRPGLLDLDKQVGTLMDQLFAAIKWQGGDEQVAARNAAAWSDRLRSCGSNDTFCIAAGYTDWIAAIKSELRALGTEPLLPLVRHSAMLMPIKPENE